MRMCRRRMRRRIWSLLSDPLRRNGNVSESLIAIARNTITIAKNLIATTKSIIAIAEDLIAIAKNLICLLLD